jgi:WXXGXW repeat (2 copies)
MRIAPYVRTLLMAIVVLAVSAASFAQIGISVRFGPPALPVYEQPPCPAEGYIWTPGYWAYDNDAGDYYWVPGTWVLAPEVGFLWTPGWWGWGGGAFLFHEGYWGPHIGFYGGINYGFGYFGHGYEGGRWDGGHFFYNRSVNNVNITNIHNVYNTTVINNTTVNRVSYNGGEGGINDRPRPEEQAAEHDRHVPAAAVQKQHEQAARSDPQQRASVNHGKPAVAATDRPGQLRGSGAVPAREAGAPYHPPAERGGTEPGRPANNVPRPENRGNEQAARPENASRPENNVPRPPATHAKELQPHQPAAPPSTGNPKLDQKYQQQQQKLTQKQNQQHQQLQQKQEQEHQRLAQNNANAARNQQVEQKHQQQTQQLEQKHTQQQQHLQQKQQPPRPKGK